MGKYSNELTRRLGGKDTDLRSIAPTVTEHGPTSLVTFPGGFSFDVYRAQALDHRVKILTPSETVTQAIAVLIDKLDLANSAYVSGYRADQLMAAQKSVLAILGSLQGMGIPLELSTPLWRLLHEMDDLVHGRTSKFLQPIGRLGNRSRDPSVVWMGRTYLVAAAHYLHCQEMSWPKAFRKVVEDLESGLDGGMKIYDLLPATRGTDRRCGGSPARAEQSEGDRQLDLAARRLSEYREKLQNAEVPGGIEGIVHGYYTMLLKHEMQYDLLVCLGFQTLRAVAAASIHQP